MIMMTHQMLGDAVLYNFRGSSYNSKISLIVFILQQRKHFCEVLLASQLFTVSTISLNYQSHEGKVLQLYLAPVLTALILTSYPQSGQKGFLLHSEPINHFQCQLFWSRSTFYSCRLCSNQVYNWF